MIRRLHVPLIQPKDVVPHLAKQGAHWRPGYSAQELAVAWASAGRDFPNNVRRVLNSAPEYLNAELVDGFFEREVDLGTPGKNSQTDLMVVTGIGSELAVIAVEGKAEESFAELVCDWNDSAGKQRRLHQLCKTLCLDPARIGQLRYQLLHRTASAIYEAQRYRSNHALMLVHSFSRVHRHFGDFATFSRALRMPLDAIDQCSPAQVFEGVSLRLAWVNDTPNVRVEEFEK